jgi:class 3 adenylate cyclase
VQALLRSASSTRSGIVATAIGIGTLIIALVAQHGGRIVKTTGDGVLIEVGSVVGAAQCAMALKFSTTIRLARGRKKDGFRSAVLGESGEPAGSEEPIP